MFGKGGQQEAQLREEVLAALGVRPTTTHHHHDRNQETGAA